METGGQQSDILISRLGSEEEGFALVDVVFRTTSPG
jgi:hypothetical protein